MTEPYVDQRQVGRRNAPDWLVTVRRGDAIQTFRFASEADAWRFIEEQDEAPDDPAPRGIGSRA